MNWRWVSLAALLATVVIAYGAFMRGDSLNVATADPPPQPGYYLRNAIVDEMQPDGSLDIRVIAERIDQQPKDDSFVMSGVRVDYLRIPERPWRLTADRGNVPADSRIVHLAGNVELRSLGEALPDSPGTLILTTDAVAIDTEKNVAYSTSSPVLVQFGPYAARMKSFAADLKNEKITAESANGTFSPQ